MTTNEEKHSIVHVMFRSFKKDAKSDVSYIEAEFEDIKVTTPMDRSSITLLKAICSDIEKLSKEGNDD